MSITKKDFSVIFSVNDANPNGDPLRENEPRTYENECGKVSDVCLKRKIRDRMMEAGHNVFVQPTDTNNDGYTTLKNRAINNIDLKQKREDIISQFCEKWLDVRAFGMVLALAKETEGKGTSIGIRGAVTIRNARSVEPVNIIEDQIIKCVSNEKEDGKGSDTMGTKYQVEKGIYVFFGSINPHLSSRTGFSEDDATIIKGILSKMFENDASSARPEGSMRVLNVIWWDHGCAGKISSGKVHDSLKVDNQGKFSLEYNGKEIITKEDCPEEYPFPEVIEGY